MKRIAGLQQWSRRLGLLGLGLTGLLLAFGGSAGQSEPPPGQPATAVYLGESDAAILRRLPPVDVQALIAAETGGEAPPLVLAVEPANAPLNAADGSELDRILAGLELPPPMLLYSGDWYGRRLANAAQALELSLSAQQLDILEAIAVARGVNTRWLLALASVKGAAVQTLALGDWTRWLYLETWRARTALEPGRTGVDQVVRFRDASGLAVAPATEPAWALLASLSAGATLAETEGALATFSDTYARAFGTVAEDVAEPAATAPFLYRPYTVPLTGRGYFDHAYPTVDYGGWPNYAGMLDYLGRTNTNYDTHDGDDFWMPYGSRIVAPADGTVLWVDTVGPDYGLLIRPPGSTYDIVIVHLSEVWVAFDDYVRRGQSIGLSGQARIAHIHFEVRHNGYQTDTHGWYGGGEDPCPAGGSGGGYRGCEASVWLWADEAPPDGRATPTPVSPTPTPLPPCSPAQVAPEARLEAESAARVLLPLVIGSGPCQAP